MKSEEAGDYKPPSEREGDRIAVEGAHAGIKLNSLIHALSLSYLTVTAPLGGSFYIGTNSQTNRNEECRVGSEEGRAKGEE